MARERTPKPIRLVIRPRSVPLQFTISQSYPQMGKIRALGTKYG
jgi:hypothetical protein